MLIKNTSPKVMGFAGIAVSPGETAQIPDIFSEKNGNKHPTMEFYLKMGWIEVITANGPLQDEPNTPKEVSVGDKLKEVPKMSLGALREEAKSLDIEFEESDTRPVLIEKITEALKSKTEQE